jgi:oxygen-dependent protoporphyrinogen oxidase
LEAVVLEENRRAGGLIETERTADGFLVEHGADSLITTTPRGVEAVRELGLGDTIVTARNGLRRYVLKEDSLHRLPEVLGGVGAAALCSLLATSQLTVRGKVRTLVEPLVRPAAPGGDESVRAFVVRRFGRELLEAVIEPLFGGIYGGDAAMLSADVCLARFREFERTDGGVVWGMRRVLRERRRRQARGEMVLPPMVSLRHGMASLPAAFGRILGDRVRLGVRVRGVEHRHGGGFRLETSAGQLDCDGIVVAVPAWRAPEILSALDHTLAALLADVPYKGIDCVSLSWLRDEVPGPLDGTGFVRATGERRPTQACTWASQKWPGRAPPGHVLVRSVLSMPEATDAEVVAAARRDLRDLMGIAAEPRVVRVRRLPRATPVYAVGHLDRVEQMAARAAALGPLGLAGNAFGGVGISDCIRSGEKAAEAVLRGLAAR